MILDATIYVGGLDEKVTDGCLWELFVQAGPVVSVNMPKDRVTGSHQGFVILYLSKLPFTMLDWFVSILLQCIGVI